MKICKNELMLYEYTEGELPEKESREIEQHLKSCEKCQTIVENYSTVKSNVFRFFDQVDLNKSDSQTVFRESKTESSGKSFARYAVLVAFFVLSFVYVLLAPVHNPKVSKAIIIQKQYNHDIDDSRWNLDVNLIENKIESIRAEIENINNNKNLR